MKLTLGFSPCPNDTFMMAAIVNQWIDTRGYDFTFTLEDVETLNEWAAQTRLDVTKMSFHRWLTLTDAYQLLDSGAALGRGCGPLIISKKKISLEEVGQCRVILPGQHTTAHLLFKRYVPECPKKEFAVFSKVEDLVLSEAYDAGVIIHENRFTYESRGLKKVEDLGALWENETGLPIPLGGIFARKTLPEAIRKDVEEIIAGSIRFAFDHPEKVMEYVRPLAQEMEEAVMRQHISLYVNEYSISLGTEGHAAVSELQTRVGQAS